MGVHWLTDHGVEQLAADKVGVQPSFLRKCTQELKQGTSAFSPCCPLHVDRISPSGKFERSQLSSFTSLPPCERG